MKDEQIYREIINRIIEIQMRLMGGLGLKIVKNVENLQLDNAGKVVKITDDPILVIQNMLMKYEEIQGDAAATMCKIAILELVKEHSDLKLPPELT